MGQIVPEPFGGSLRPASAVVCFQVEDLDQSCKELMSKGVEFAAGPRKQVWGGRTALLLDPDQNIVVLTEAE